MPRPSKVEQLPQELREELDERLVERGFADYHDLSDWLSEHGHEISKSSLGRYGKDFKDRLGALRVAAAQAREITKAMDDDEGAMGEALTSLAQEKAFQVLMQMQADDQDVPIDRLMKSIAKLGSTGVQQKEFRLEVRARARQAADETEEVLRAEGLSDEVAGDIKSKILGITE